MLCAGVCVPRRQWRRRYRSVEPAKCVSFPPILLYLLSFRFFAGLVLSPRCVVLGIVSKVRVIDLSIHCIERILFFFVVILGDRKLRFLDNILKSFEYRFCFVLFFVRLCRTYVSAAVDPPAKVNFLTSARIKRLCFNDVGFCHGIVRLLFFFGVSCRWPPPRPGTVRVNTNPNERRAWLGCRGLVGALKCSGCCAGICKDVRLCGQIYANCVLHERTRLWFIIDTTVTYIALKRFAHDLTRSKLHYYQYR